MNYKKLNLRIVPTYSFADTYGTGDHHRVTKYNVVRDFTKEEVNRPIKYSIQVIEKGVTVETFKSEVNANIFIQALLEINHG